MSYAEDDYLLLSGLQHFAFCRRQWALIHLENQWAENLRTTEGRLLHERAHDVDLRERRGELLTVRGVAVSSASLGVSGACDVLEYRRSPDGVALPGLDGFWLRVQARRAEGARRGHTPKAKRTEDYGQLRTGK